MINSTSYACAVIAEVQDAIVVVRRVMFFNACSVFSFSFLLSAWLCGIVQRNELVPANQIKVPTVELDIKYYCNLGNPSVDTFYVVMHLKKQFWL